MVNLWTKPNQNLIEPNRSDCCTIGSVIENIELELFRSSIAELNRHDYFDFVRQKDKTHPELEISPSTVYVKQFEINKYLN